MDLITVYSLYMGMAFAVALGLVFLVGGTLHMGVKRPDGFLIYLFVPMMLAIAVGTLSSGRDLSLPEEMVTELTQSGGVAKWLQRLTSIFLLAASVQQIASFAFSKRRPDTPRGLMAAFVLFWFCTVALPATLGTRASVQHEYIYALIIGFAALLTSENGAHRAIVWARNALIVFLLGGLVLLAVKKSMVLAPYLGGLIPGFQLRYSGLAAGPNAMGPLAVLALVCLWCSPFSRRQVQVCSWVIAIATLFMTQSRTSWIAALLCFLTLLFIQHKGRLKGFGLGRQYKLISQTALLGLMLLVLLVMIALISGAFDARVSRFFESRVGSDLLTLTGRTEIWAVALQEWRRSPVFGYGPLMWDAYHRFQIGYAAAFHAHNQFLNVLAVSGVVGLLSFLVYLVVLIKRLLPRLTAFNGFPAALSILIMVRSISEVPISLHNFGSESLFHILLLMLVAGAAVPAKTKPQIVAALPKSNRGPRLV